jgi:hypothetical protein
MVFASIGLKCKAWAYSGEPPPSVVTILGGSVKVAGQRWKTEIDALEIPVPDLPFGKKQRKNLPDSTKIFKGSFGELDNCVPKN